MAQTKAKASSKRSAGSKKPQTRSRGSTKKSANSRKRQNGAKSTPVAAVSDATDKATTAVGNAADKAKVPLMAGGAALAGVAGGVMLGARQARRHRHRGRTLAKAAKGAGTLGAQVGHLAYELQRNRETNGDSSKQHRSPVEVVLEGLTARRSRP